MSEELDKEDAWSVDVAQDSNEHLLRIHEDLTLIPTIEIKKMKDMLHRDFHHKYQPWK